MRITDKDKEEACIEFNDYLVLVYYLGKGVMFSSQLQRYLEMITEVGRSEYYRNLKVLQQKGLIDIHKFHNNNYIKLKKYSVKYLLQKDSTNEVKSINYSFTTLKRSAFISEMILTIFIIDNTISVNKLINFLLTKTTLISKRNSNSKIFKELKEYKDPSIFLRDEVHNLDLLENKNLMSIRNKKTVASIEKRSEFNINNMQSRNIFILKILDDEITVSILDLNDNYGPARLCDNIYNTCFYLSSILDNRKFEKKNRKVVFKMFFSSQSAKNRMTKEIGENGYVTKKLTERRLIRNLAYDIVLVNLDLRSRVFNNVNIIL